MSFNYCDVTGSSSSLNKKENLNREFSFLASSFLLRLVLFILLLYALLSSWPRGKRRLFFKYVSATYS